MLFFLLALAAWLGFGYLVSTFDPRSDSSVVVAGALLLGGAITFTLAPLLFVGGYARHRHIAFRGDWLRSLRRAGLAGGAVALFVILRAQDALNPALAIFIVAMAVLTEVTLSRGR